MARKAKVQEEEPRITPTGSTPASVEERVEEAPVKTVSSDYLRQYQYGRELPLGDPRTDPQKDGKAFAMKQALLKQPKVRIIVPVESGSDPKVPYSVTLNGYRLDLPRNTYIEVPEQVAEVIMQSQKQISAALAQMRVDRDKDHTDAL